VNYEIVELEKFSGNKATIYSIILEGDEITLFDHFVRETLDDFKKELKFIAGRLQIIGQTTGARDKFFKLNEGKPGDGVCALYDEPGSMLRLYCIRYANVAIILGGGGPKPSEIRKWQDDKKLTLEAQTMIQVSNDILQRLQSGDLEWSKDGYHLIGDLIIKNNDEE